jgi:hypothetical protein
MDFGEEYRLSMPIVARSTALSTTAHRRRRYRGLAAEKPGHEVHGAFQLSGLPAKASVDDPKGEPRVPFWKTAASGRQPWF